jgi:hypothetical protein
MRDSRQTLEQQFLEMRWRCLSLAADLDRLDRQAGAGELWRSDPRLQTIRKALGTLHEDSPKPDRAARLQMLFSDMTPPPQRG